MFVKSLQIFVAILLQTEVVQKNILVFLFVKLRAVLRQIISLDITHPVRSSLIDFLSFCYLIRLQLDDSYKKLFIQEFHRKQHNDD